MVSTASTALPHIPGYSIIEQIYAGSKTTVYRAQPDSQQHTVVIKVLQREYPSFSELVQFRNQYTITKNLTIPGIVKPLSLEPWRHSFALVMEDMEGISLQQYTQEQPLDWSEACGIALQLAAILHNIAQYRVVHKDIKPANILIHPNTGIVKIIDFSISSLLPKEIQELKNPHILEGTLAYLAPEQTGRMNRGIDYRTDFYSLGVTLYELLTGQLPFPSDDPLELVYCHIAKQPIPPHEIQPTIPMMVSAIVLKLMGKNAEDRYQSALGIKYDLEECIRQGKETGTIAEFTLAQQDVSDRFVIPEKLYGREHEVQTLLDAFESVAQGQSTMMLVAGFSGIGKTAVIKEVHKPIVEKRGYFIKGKYDQFNRNIPFSAFVIAFRDLMGQLLGESDAELAVWKNRILSAVGDNGNVLINVIPELEGIIGEQPPVSELSGNAAQNRFNLLLQKFIAVFTTKEHPLVIFLDDLQWADSASLNLIKVLMGESQTGYLLLLGAYRDNEVFPAHPLMLCLADLAKQCNSGYVSSPQRQTTISTITLAPLSSEHINQLVAETLSCKLKIAEPLAELVYQKTQGNPFFTTQFLTGLYEDDLIVFNSHLGYWECDLVKVREAALTDDVVEFMIGRLHKLPHSTQEVLKLAACIGNQFDLETLSIIYQSPWEEVATNLWSALQSGLILPQSEAYKFFQEMEGESQGEGIAVGYNFLHDRVQQAAYALIQDDHKQITHLNIGRLLLQQISPGERDKNLFKIVNQLNMGIPLIEQTREIEDLAQLNLVVAKKAKSSAAYNAAANYLNTGIGLLCTPGISIAPWKTHYALMLPLHNLLAEVSYLNGEYEVSQQQIQTVLDNAQDILDSVKAYEISISVSVAQGEFQRALDVGLEILSLLNVSLEDTPLPDIDIDYLYTLPKITNSFIIAALRVLSKLWAPAFTATSELLPSIIVTMLNLSVTYGNSGTAAFAYALYGMLLCAMMEDIELGYRFGQLALHILDQYETAELTCKVNQLVYAFIRNWKELARERVECLADNVFTGLENGDLEFACYSAINYCDNLFLIGESLDTIYQKQTYYIELAKNIQQLASDHALSSWGQMVENLMGMTAEPTQLVGQRFDEFVAIPEYQEMGASGSLFFAYIAKMMLSYWFGDYEATLIHAQSAINHQQVGMLPNAQIPLYGALALLALYPTAHLEKQTQILEEVKTHQQSLAFWANHAPENFQHKLDLVAAETARILHHREQGIELYDRAIAGAKEYQYLQEEALANELAAQFYLEWGKDKIAAVYLQEAYYCYSRWGAKAKTDDLEQNYPQLLTPILYQSQTPLTVSKTVTSVAKTAMSQTSEGVGILDFSALMKACRTLSQEIDSDRAINNLMQVILENAGAETVALMLFRDDTLRLEAKITEGKIKTINSLPLEKSQEIPLAIINTVKRTHKPLILDDARQQNPYLGDPYIQKYQPRSVFCLPLQDRGRSVGILYLENNQSTGAFTRERAEVLSLLCAQAAITLENARLYQQAQQALQLERELHQLQRNQLQLIQSEKMYSLGQMVGGIAHEINNPISFIHGNINHAHNYTQDLMGLIDLYQHHYPQAHPEICEELEVIDLEFIQQDLQKLFGSMRTGSDRIKNIVTSLRTFARLDESEFKAVNIHEGIESTLSILQNRLQSHGKRRAIKVVKEYGDLPLFECYAGQLNQVFLNVFNNAIDALENSGISSSLIINIHTEWEGEQVNITISDNGIGMSKEHKKQIFDPFFTTKTVGQGTGLGMAIAYQIITEKHGGKILCESELGKGTQLFISLPLR